MVRRNGVDTASGGRSRQSEPARMAPLNEDFLEHPEKFVRVLHDLARYIHIGRYGANKNKLMISQLAYLVSFSTMPLTSLCPSKNGHLIDPRILVQERTP